MKPIIQISMLGDHRLGRWGNTLFQYASGKTYANKMNAVFEISANWHGRKVFTITDPVPSCRLPSFGHMLPNGPVNIDMFGWYQYQDAIDAWDMNEVRQWFTIRPEILEPYIKQTQEMGTYIACHRRSGDYRETPYAIIERKAYIDAIDRYGFNRSHIVFFGDEEKHNLPNFIKDPEISYISDFIYIILAPVIFRGNSTFSWWAAQLASHNDIYSPVIQNLNGIVENVPFIKGNHPSCVPYGPMNTDLHKRK